MVRCVLPEHIRTFWNVQLHLQIRLTIFTTALDFVVFVDITHDHDDSTTLNSHCRQHNWTITHRRKHQIAGTSLHSTSDLKHWLTLTHSFLHQCSDTTEAHCRHRRHTSNTADTLQTHWVDHYIFSNTPPHIVNLFQTSELIGHQEHHQGKHQNWLVTLP